MRRAVILLAWYFTIVSVTMGPYETKQACIEARDRLVAATFHGAASQAKGIQCWHYKRADR